MLERLLAKKWQKTVNIDVDLKNIQSPTLYHNLPFSLLNHVLQLTQLTSL